MSPVEMSVTILVAVLGSGALNSLIIWLTRRADRRDTTPSAADIDAIDVKLDRDYRHMQLIDEKIEKLTGQVSDVDLTLLKQCLFSRPRDQNAFTSALNSGEEYLAKGGNGEGHIRYDQLRREYEWRDSHDDWNPEHRPEQGGYHA